LIAARMVQGSRIAPLSSTRLLRIPAFSPGSSCTAFSAGPQGFFVIFAV
jgi:hypothetical protein